MSYCLFISSSHQHVQHMMSQILLILIDFDRVSDHVLIGNYSSLNRYSSGTRRDINPSGTKGFGTHTKHEGGGGGESKRIHLQYLKNEKCYKPETFRGVRSILQGLKKLQVGITVFAW